MKYKGLLMLTSKKFKEYMSLYDVYADKDYIQLNYSQKQDSWNYKGKPAYSLSNTGNGLLFIDEKSGHRVELDYSQAEALRALLKLEDRDDTKFKLIKV